MANNAAEALVAGGRTAEAAALIDPLTTAPPDRDHWMSHACRAEIDVLRGDLEAAAKRWQQITACTGHKTASVHVTGILRKLGAANRVKGAALAERPACCTADSPKAGFRKSKDPRGGRLRGCPIRAFHSRRILGARLISTEEATMNPITQHHPAAPPARRQRLRRRGRARTVPARAGIIVAVAAAVLFAGALIASAAPAQPARGAVGAPAGSMLNATFTDTDVSVTPGQGMVELILAGTGTVQGFGAATDVVGVVEDFAASPCGPGGASNSAQARIVTHSGVLELHEAAMNCVTASGPRVTGTYRVDGPASTGIFAGARGTGHVTVDVATGQDTLSGTLILIPSAV